MKSFLSCSYNILSFFSFSLAIWEALFSGTADLVRGLLVGAYLFYFYGSLSWMLFEFYDEEMLDFEGFN